MGYRIGVLDCLNQYLYCTAIKGKADQNQKAYRFVKHLSITADCGIQIRNSDSDSMPCITEVAQSVSRVEGAPLDMVWTLSLSLKHTRP
jgi:hypothetical protein